MASPRSQVSFVSNYVSCKKIAQFWNYDVLLTASGHVYILALAEGKAFFLYCSLNLEIFAAIITKQIHMQQLSKQVGCKSEADNFNPLQSKDLAPVSSKYSVLSYLSDFSLLV
jgi:hypothetical protein